MTGSDDDSMREAHSRLDAVTREVDALEDDVRSAAERLRAGLARVREEIDQLATRVAEADAGGGHVEGADVDGARLAALDLVLRRTPREEAQALIAEQFPGVDAGLLLDEVSEASSG